MLVVYPLRVWAALRDVWGLNLDLEEMVRDLDSVSRLNLKTSLQELFSFKDHDWKF